LTRPRDQELRFIVYDTPDYYRMKCSIFNDDKKTDLIGEAWIDLRDVIVPGGGQNDLWHQLNFKGKYAGDIRMEMTYYDTRVDAEQLTDKKRSRAKGDSSSGERNPLSGPKQLGPREIQRRPLPQSPGQPQTNDMPAPLKIQSRQQQSPPRAQMHGHPQALQPQHQYQSRSPPETPDDYGYEYALDEYDQYEPYQPNHTQHKQQHNQQAYDDYHYQDFDDPGYQQQGDTFRPLYESHTPPQVPPKTPWHQSQHSDPFQGGSPHSHPPSLGHAPMHSSPPAHESPPAPPPDMYRDHRVSASPTKYVPYRDSPLRQSMSHQEPQLPPALPPPDMYAIEAPPAPPTHRGSLPPQTVHSYSAAPREQHVRAAAPPPQANTIGDRSPLQMLEHRYTPQSNRSSGRRLSHLSQQDQPKQLSSSPGDAVAGDFPAPHQLSLNYGIDFVDEPVEQDRQGRYIRRNSAVELQDFQRPPQRAQTFDVADVFDNHNTFRSEPQLVKPRAVSPNVNHTVPRKSVSPHPYLQGERPRMSGVPFGPDSFDSFNPGSSPVSHGHPTPDQNREVARQIEVDKLRDQGPIIGNDGRVIDPSDHLPSDTWAPEPERKNRKPEHVIHVRRKNESQQPRADSSPMPLKPVATFNSPYQVTPEPAPSSAPNSGRRNRLQKQNPTPTRPLPTQPFMHPHSSPGAIPQVGSHHSTPQSKPHSQRSMPPSPNTQRSHTTPQSGPPRPSLSEYQVPVHNGYNPRHSYAQYPITPTKAPQMPQIQRPQSFAFGGGGEYDPLAAELSMIDIGPSRGGGRTALRSNHAYPRY
jgi:hypothetical protein